LGVGPISEERLAAGESGCDSPLSGRVRTESPLWMRAAPHETPFFDELARLCNGSPRLLPRDPRDMNPGWLSGNGGRSPPKELPMLGSGVLSVDLSGTSAVADAPRDPPRMELRVPSIGAFRLGSAPVPCHTGSVDPAPRRIAPDPSPKPANGKTAESGGGVSRRRQRFCSEKVFRTTGRVSM